MYNFTIFIIYTHNSFTARCPALQPIPNGVLTYGPTFTPSSAAYFDQGTLALYTCNAGFTLVGSESQLCLAGGIWSGQPPVCQRKIILGSGK